APVPPAADNSLLRTWLRPSYKMPPSRCPVPLKEAQKNRPSKAIAFERREQSIFVVPAVPLSLPPYKTGGRSARSPVRGESLLHDNGQVPSAPTAKGH